MLRTMRRQQLWIALLLLLSLAGQACSDSVQGGIIMPADAKGDTKGFKFDVKGSDVGDGGEQIEDADEGFDSINQGDVGCHRVIIAQFDNTKPMVLTPSGTPYPLFVTVVDYAAGGPAGSIPVSWEIVENDGIAGPGPGTLGNQVSATDDKNGATHNTFNSNKGPSTNYKIKISAECAEPLFVDIMVDSLPAGNIDVKILYDNQIPLGSVTTKLVQAPFACASFKPILPPSVVLNSMTGTVSQTFPFKNLPSDKKYGVFILGKDLGGHLAAAGCADGILVNDKSTTQVTVTVTVLPLQAAGPYDMINHFDFTGAIPGQLGQILDTAVQIFYDPGAFIIEQIKNLVKQWLPSIIVDAAFGLFEKQLASFVTDWLLNSSPSWMQDFFQMGQDVLQIVKKLEMLGILKVYKVGSDFFFNGEIDFTGINLWWHLGCDKNDPNFATCGTKISLDLTKAITDPNFPLDFFAGKLSGSISQQTHMSIDSSSITLNYGKLILYVLTDVVLYKITGKTTFTGALQALINCPGLGSGLGGIIPGLNASDVENLCNTTVTLLALPLENLIGGLKIDSGMSLKGTCTMVDDPDKDGNYDLKVDRLIDGVWVGNIIVQGSAGKNFKGDFTATRQPGF